MKTIEKIASGIVLVAGLSLATYGIIDKAPESSIYVVSGATLTGASVGSYFAIRKKYLQKDQK
ncbi:MAG: hypothetical protein WCW53_16570 [Syntrophales bacterium]|jgi:hypothetical protein